MRKKICLFITLLASAPAAASALDILDPTQWEVTERIFSDAPAAVAPAADGKLFGLIAPSDH